MTVTAAQLIALIEEVEPRLRRAFIELVQYLEDQHQLEDILRAIEQGGPEGALRNLEVAAERMASQVVAAYTLAAGKVMATVGEALGQVYTIDTTNIRAVEAMRAAKLDLIVGFTVQQQEAVRTIMLQAIEDGLNPREQARMFRHAVGLTPYQAQVVANYRRALLTMDPDALTRRLRDRRFDPLIENRLNPKHHLYGKPLTTAQVDKMVEAYRRKWIDYRAKAIARTEALRAVHEGSEEAYAQVAERGDIGRDEMEFTWIHAGRGKESRDFHVSMHGQKRRFGEPFRSGHGNLLRYPCDPRAPASETVHCRCTKTMRIKLREA